MPISFSSPTNRDSGARGAGVTAVLGPTNTGKTHLAIERMLGHSSGIIGLPLRLLAREVYNKVAARVGAEAVALVTGEEKIKPPSPRYWVSTVEAMPRDLDVAFLAIDEVQLAADLERGHVFTDRMLNRRGREETLVLGAQTVRPMVERLLPGAHVLTRPRLSQLSFAGEKKITRLPRRSAIVAFSAEEVYAIAELIRRQRGGAAVVLGSLSPRTRNAQVALYQAGDVDYLVATDAIGMGLNLDVDHVAFASDRKFDGFQFRRLNPAELAQIAGRAGRANRDGTFGTTGRCAPFETELAQALESHSFEPISVLQWRNTDLDFFSVGALQASLAEVPKESGLTRAPVADDVLILEHAVRDDDVRAVAQTRESIERLWEVCQVPDYRKISPAAHAELVVAIYSHLMRDGTIPVDWFALQVDLADNAEGDIDTLSNRIAHIRTWTFAANRPDWLADPAHWQEVTRAVEDKLSDALHERLTERFVDRRTSVLMRRMRENTALETDISKTGDVVVEGHSIGRLDGFTFTPDASAAGSEARTLAGAAQKALAGEIDARAQKASQAPNDQFVLATDGAIRWMGQPVGKLLAGEEVLKPRVRIIADEHLTGPARDLVQARLDLWVKAHIEKFLGPLLQLLAAEDITGMARGVAFQLAESVGVIERQKIAEEVKGLDQPSRATLRKYGVRFGAYHIYLPILLKPAPRVLATQLWALKHESPETKGLDAIERLAASGRTSIAADKEAPRVLYRTAGYRVCGERAVRVDILERLADIVRPALAWRGNSPGQKPAAAFDGSGFVVTVAMTSLTGCSGEEFASILRALGYRMEKRPKPAAVPAGTGTSEAGPSEAGPSETLPADTAAVSSEMPGVAAADPTSAVDGATAHGATDGAPHGELASAQMPAVNPLPGDTATAEIISAEPTPAAPTDALTPDAPTPDTPTSDAPTVAAPLAEVPKDTAIEVAVAPAATAPTDGEASTSIASASEEASPEPEFVEVWRIRSEEGSRQHRRPGHGDRHRDQRAPVAAVAASQAPAGEGDLAAADSAAVQPGDGQPTREHRRPRRRGGPRRDGEQGAARHGGAPAERETRLEGAVRAEGAEGAESPHGQERSDRPDRPPHRDRPDRAERTRAERPRGERPRDERPRGERPRDERPNREQRANRNDRPERDPELRSKYIKGRSERDRRDSTPDPNSPFAKLAALKEQLEANAKDRR